MERGGGVNRVQGSQTLRGVVDAFGLKFTSISRYFLYVGQKLLSIPAEVEWKKGRAGSIQTSYNQLCKGLAEDTEKLVRH